jgi:hypothetical protein
MAANVLRHLDRCKEWPFKLLMAVVNMNLRQGVQQEGYHMNYVSQCTVNKNVTDLVPILVELQSRWQQETTLRCPRNSWQALATGSSV